METQYFRTLAGAATAIWLVSCGFAAAERGVITKIIE